MNNRYEQEIIEMEAKMANMKVSGGYTREILQDIFTAIQNPKDWKAPIIAEIAPSLEDKVLHAITFFTATTPTFTVLESGYLKVEADGYRKGPAGDH